MTKSKLPRGIRLYIRKEKARIRREISSPEEREKLLQEISRRFFKKDEKKK